MVRVMVMSDKKPRQTKILDRGNYLTPREDVTPDVPAFLPAMPQGAPKNRLGFARWLFLPEHPLTARVQVNRLWQMFFGNGLVKTGEDFGVQGRGKFYEEVCLYEQPFIKEQTMSVSQLIASSLVGEGPSPVKRCIHTQSAVSRWFRVPCIDLKNAPRSAR